ncbi:hypothetical protein SYNTR_2270 [Candidatus Syntrophocurvum alkaliphilum]|uniref:Uncharacterized protein n=1 Tax=Candidatus Syntrophocurvum alkaliphilum TaxID=2293317 RepID=A0A6I6DJA0_9FIRM|nr:hypothetical protein [Candidatus Syntrophocurvum alkaliphilum]QGU00864.1 hypothetical protein SYNTR_2270 [Candidatus Syntrophocurvum alkaliphilum]
MIITLSIIAVLILLVYSPYFFHIIKGSPEKFEYEMLKALANWMITKGKSIQLQLWIMLILSILLEIIYFVLVFNVIDNYALIILTAIFAGFEVYHIITLTFSFNKFFKGNKILKDLFNWSVERLSASLFFTHALVVLLSLIFFNV